MRTSFPPTQPAFSGLGKQLALTAALGIPLACGAMTLGGSANPAQAASSTHSREYDILYKITDAQGQATQFVDTTNTVLKANQRTGVGHIDNERHVGYTWRTGKTQTPTSKAVCKGDAKGNIFKLPKNHHTKAVAKLNPHTGVVMSVGKNPEKLGRIQSLANLNSLTLPLADRAAAVCTALKINRDL